MQTIFFNLFKRINFTLIIHHLKHLKLTFAGKLWCGYWKENGPGYNRIYSIMSDIALVAFGPHHNSDISQIYPMKLDFPIERIVYFCPFICPVHGVLFSGAVSNGNDERLLWELDSSPILFKKLPVVTNALKINWRKNRRNVIPIPIFFTHDLITRRQPHFYPIRQMYWYVMSSSEAKYNKEIGGLHCSDVIRARWRLKSPAS